jgi:phospholipase/carboxylesterase
MSRRRVVAGTRPFVRDVPWRLHLPAEGSGPAPLLVALHGKGDRAEVFEEEALDALPAGWALLVPSGPIPRDRSGKHPLGDAWYLYDGDTPAFRESLIRAEGFLLDLLEHLRSGTPGSHAVALDFDRVALLGFSQGAYLAGTLAVRHPRSFRAAVLVAGRLKHEMLAEHFRAAKSMRLLGLHGRDDPAVLPAPSRASMEAARAAGLDAEFREIEGGHAFTPEMRAVAREWLSGTE